MAVTDSLELLANPPGPDFSAETRLMSSGKQVVAGVDEAGRGPLAGPVVAAAVVLHPRHIPDGLNDSKKLTARQRDLLFDQILLDADCAWASLTASEIDALNIRTASLKAMELAVQGLPCIPDSVLVDGRDLPAGLARQGEAMIKGDARSLSIAAASIVAKVVRDRMMVAAASRFPQYGFEKHKGYGSRVHREAIERHGACALHRLSFAPMRYFTKAETDN